MEVAAVGAVPSQARLQQTTTNAPLIEPRNTISHPVDARSHFSLGEGTYRLRDEITLGTIPPHPSETANYPVNVLDTKPIPPSAGTRLSIAVLAPRQSTAFQRRPLVKPGFKSSFDPSLDGSESSQPESDRGSTRGHHGLTKDKTRFGDGNPNLMVLSTKDQKDSLKRKKPKNSITKSSSSFVSRVIVHDALSKRLHDHPEDGIYAFINMGRSLQWFDLSVPNKQDQLTKILFTKAHALCHDFNDYSKTPSHLDIILGFSTSEIIWYEPMTQKYTRLNKNGIINASSISQIRWLPGSENLFITAHFDGTLTVFDKEKDDAAMITDEIQIEAARNAKNAKPSPRLAVRKSVMAKNQKTNPLAFWKASSQRINDMAFSPDGRLLALACEDGTLQVIDYVEEILIDAYHSYYGGFTCICWSPDSSYVLTGGQDDLVTIWSMENHSIVARCMGHRSWVSAIAFDPWTCDSTTYRLGSVGEDGRLLLWDFSVGMLDQPRAASIRQSISSYAPGPIRSDSDATVIPLNDQSTESSKQRDDYIVHTTRPRAEVTSLPPVMSKEIDVHALCWLRFEEDCIITSCRGGHVRTFDRPNTGLVEASDAEVLPYPQSSTVDIAH